MREIFFVLIFICASRFCVAQGEPTSKLEIYRASLNALNELVVENNSQGFKKAVFISENTYLHRILSFDSLNKIYVQLSRLTKAWASNNSMNDYDGVDSIQMLLNRGVFQVIKDTIKIQAEKQLLCLLPFEYNFEDYDGKMDWSNTFVSTLLSTHKGNCHSLPYLYKILADEVGARCWLALAPNHMYIKNYSKRDGWFNTELTSGEFPIDAWLTTTNYITLTAIQNGLYCDTLSNQQSIALCAIDLAKAYEKETTNYYDGFMLQCCDLVLKYHAVNPQALLLKAETLKRIYQLQDKEGSSEAKNTYNNMEQLYVHLYDLGYREMPDKMYKEWLQSLKSQKDKYGNKKISR